MYGPHLLLDCYDADGQALQSVEKVFDFLDNVPALIGMQKIGPPQIARFSNTDIDGVTGIIMIVTSHISIHTYSLRKYFFLDVFSCKEFDKDLVIDFAQKTFGFKKFDEQLIIRGKNILCQ